MTEKEEKKEVVLLPNAVQYPVYRTITVESIEKISHSFVKIITILCGFGFLLWISHSLSDEQITWLVLALIVAGVISWIVLLDSLVQPAV